MNTILESGQHIIEGLQSFRTPFWDNFFLFFTELGSEFFFLAALPIIWWGYSEKLGWRFTLLIFISFFINLSLKELIGQPRPFELMPSLGMIAENGYGFPSGHAQQSIVFWVYVAYLLRSKWSWALAIGLTFFIGLSRVYLGVHFPTDILGGWAVGGATLYFFVRLTPWIDKQRARKSQLIFCAAFAAVLLVWAFLLTTSYAYALVGAFSGVLFGSAMLPPAEKKERISWTTLVRLFAGALVMAILYFGLRLALPKHGESLYFTFVIVRYFICGVWLSYLAPKIFRSLGRRA